jgi:hypothetical protein
LLGYPRIPNGVCSDENEGAAAGCHFGQASSSANLGNLGGRRLKKSCLGLIAFRTGCPKNILLAENAFI